jgi:AraC family transcriptional regulator
VRRVAAHLRHNEAQIEEKISVDALATLAGLSAPHFTRALSHSAGLPPHTYVLRRLEPEELMLRNTHLPLSEIAAAVNLRIKATFHAISTV